MNNTTNNNSNVVQFVSRPVSILWQPAKRIKASWRVSAGQSVIEFRRPNPTVSSVEIDDGFLDVKPDADLLRRWRDRLYDKIEEQDNLFEDNYLCNYVDLIVDALNDEVLSELRRNWNPSSMDWDDLLSYVQRAGVKPVRFAGMVKAVADCSTAGIYTQANECYSLPLGEHEYIFEIDDDDELTALWSEMDHATRAATTVSGETGQVICYGRPTERIVWTIDLDRLIDYIEQETGVLYV